MLYLSVPFSILSVVSVNEILGVHLEGYLEPRDFLNKSEKNLSYLFLLFHMRGVATLGQVFFTTGQVKFGRDLLGGGGGASSPKSLILSPVIKME